MTLDVRGVGGGVVRVRNDRLIGIARTELLAVLQRHAEKAGVRLEFGAPAQRGRPGRRRGRSPPTGSAARPGRTGPFGEHVETGRGLYLWCGTDFALDDAVFAPVATEHGTFVTHAYPYAERAAARSSSRPTRPTWRRAGLRRHHRRRPRPTRRTRRRCATCETAFAAQLQRPPVDRQPHPVAAVPHRACDRWSQRARPCCSATPRTRRTSPSAPARSSRWRTRSRWSRRCATRRIGASAFARVRAPSPSGRGAAAGARPAQQAVVGVVPGAAVAARRPADGGVHDRGRGTCRSTGSPRPARTSWPRRCASTAAVRARPTRPPSPGWVLERQAAAPAALGDRRRAVRRPVGPGGGRRRRASGPGAGCGSSGRPTATPC